MCRQRAFARRPRIAASAFATRRRQATLPHDTGPLFGKPGQTQSFDDSIGMGLLHKLMQVEPFLDGECRIAA